MYVNRGSGFHMTHSSGRVGRAGALRPQAKVQKSKPLLRTMHHSIAPTPPSTHLPSGAARRAPLHAELPQALIVDGARQRVRAQHDLLLALLLQCQRVVAAGGPHLRQQHRAVKRGSNEHARWKGPASFALPPAAVALGLGWPLSLLMPLETLATPTRVQSATDISLTSRVAVKPSGAHLHHRQRLVEAPVDG